MPRLSRPLATPPSSASRLLSPRFIPAPRARRSGRCYSQGITMVERPHIRGTDLAPWLGDEPPTAGIGRSRSGVDSDGDVRRASRPRPVGNRCRTSGLCLDVRCIPRLAARAHLIGRHGCFSPKAARPELLLPRDRALSGRRCQAAQRGTASGARGCSLPWPADACWLTVRRYDGSERTRQVTRASTEPPIVRTSPGCRIAVSTGSPLRCKPLVEPTSLTVHWPPRKLTSA